MVNEVTAVGSSSGGVPETAIAWKPGRGTCSRDVRIALQWTSDGGNLRVVERKTWGVSEMVDNSVAVNVHRYLVRGLDDASA
jgi:hypothetical protein